LAGGVNKDVVDIVAQINAKFKDSESATNTEEVTAAFCIEIEINDYPQKARWKVTNKVSPGADLAVDQVVERCFIIPNSSAILGNDQPNFRY
jgi:hypothetical protein